jgi:NADP-dependent 3-hydroxy acid dehydrogenase YdfG
MQTPLQVTVKAFHGDVRDTKAIKRMINYIAEELEGLDVVAVNA